MNSFNEILNEIYDKVKEKHLYTKDFNLLLEYAITLWTKKIDFQKNISPEIFRACRIKVEPLPGKLFSHFGHD
jgi:hypothetical protein